MLVRLRRFTPALALALAFAFAPLAPAPGRAAPAAPDPSPEILSNGAAAIGCGLGVRYFPALMALSPTGGALIVASVCLFALFEAAVTRD